MFLSALYGSLFGVVVGGLMRLPGKETLLDANAANLSVMTALWLGALLTGGAAKGVMVREVLVAVLSFACAAAAFQGRGELLIVGFALQAIWSLAHIRGQLGVRVVSGYPMFAVATNIAFALTYLTLDRLT